jgi:hypothetical protein
MNVGSVIRTFGLSQDRIVAKASATEDYARILIERGAESPKAADGWRIRAASAQTIAGSLWMLVRPQRARTPLGYAEEIHDTIGSAYGSLLGICAHPRDPAYTQPLAQDVWSGPQVERRDNPEREEPSAKDIPAFAHVQPAASLLAHVWPLAVGQTDLSLKQLLADSPVLEELPDSWLTGRLRIPLAHYRAVATEIDQLRHSKRTDGRRRVPLTAARAFLERASEVIDAASENEYQWRTLRSPILPTEPEVLAVCTLVELTARGTLGLSALELIDPPANSFASALMGVAENLLDTDSDATLGTPQ